MTRAMMQSGLTPRAVFIALALLLVIGMVLTEYVADMARQRANQIRSMEATALLAKMRAQLESEVNAVLYLSRGLITFISAYPDSDPARWHDLSREIIGEAPLVRNIGLAPDNVARFVYPLKGNESVIGLDYRQNEAQWPAVEAAIVSGKMTLAGPLDLIQGGRGVVARSPVFYTRGMRKHYWGLASIVIDFDQLLVKAGISAVDTGYAIAIRGRDGSGESGEVFFGESDVFQQPIAKMGIAFPGGEWVIAARPVSEQLSSVIWLRAVAWVLLGILLGLILVIYRFYRLAYQQSLTDPLTGEANRRCLMNRAEHLTLLYPRSGIGFAMLFMDLNGFKQVNDTYGHHVGDKLLVEVARRLRANSRASDTLARNGGDEFILLQPGVGLEDVQQLATKLEVLLEQPFTVDGRELHISASMGYAVFPDESDDFETIINLADERMYAGKHNGVLGEERDSSRVARV